MSAPVLPGMEEALNDAAAAPERGTASLQTRMWRNFQEKTKPFLSPKQGLESGGEGKKDTAMWIFRRKRKQVLDRVISSSQPNLCCSVPASGDGDASRGGRPVQSRVGPPSADTDSRTEAPLELESNKPTLSHLVLSHQKSSSLGSACFQSLVVGEEERELRKNASDSVTEEQRMSRFYRLQDHCEMPHRPGPVKHPLYTVCSSQGCA
ncbi:multiple C2 and transmembrane domain-containing protein 1-like isoform X2 [Arapaima gigas]